MRKSIYSLFALLATILMCLPACTGSKETREEAKIDTESFYETQPVHSGLYDADYYDITGTNPRRGHFDGRIYFSLSPETSAFYVFENGNRTKIDILVPLQKPFEKTDSGTYCTTDTKDRLVTITPDSTMLVLAFQRSGDDYKITFNPKPRHTGSAVEILEKMNAQKNKN